MDIHYKKTLINQLIVEEITGPELLWSKNRPATGHLLDNCQMLLTKQMYAGQMSIDKFPLPNVPLSSVC